MLDIFEDLGIDERPMHVKMDLKEKSGSMDSSYAHLAYLRNSDLML